MSQGIAIINILYLFKHIQDLMFLAQAIDEQEAHLQLNLDYVIVIASFVLT